MIPFVNLKAQYVTIQDEVKAAIDQVLESQQFILGSRVKELEEKIAAYCRVSDAIGVASGTDALLLSYMAAGIAPNDEVITTPYTFFSTAGSISRLGAKPVFVDIDPRTYNINPKLIEAKMTKRTKAIVAVDLFGQTADMDEIVNIAKKHKLFVIEDAAQAFGASYQGKPAGSMGDLGTLSFFPTKNLGGFGDGGMVLTNNKDFAEKIRILRVHGSRTKYHHEILGVGSRLDAIQAAVLLVKMTYIDRWNKKRQANAGAYNALLKGLPLEIPFVQESNVPVYHQYVVRTKARDPLREFLAKKDIQTEIHYPLPLHLQECYNTLGYKKGSLPEAEKASQETLALPIYPEIKASELEEVAGQIKEFFTV